MSTPTQGAGVSSECVAPVKWHFLLLAALVVVVFGRAVTYPYNNWDETVFIAQNPLVAPGNWHGLHQLWKPGAVDQEVLYVPVTYASFWVDMALGGGRAWLLHITNLVLHLLNIWLLLRFCSRTGLNRTIGFVAGLIFAIHPIQTETVVWLMGRKDLLSGTFALLFAHVAWVWLKTRKPWLVVALTLFLTLGLLAKPSLVLLPVVLLAARIWVGTDRETRTRDCLFLIPMFAIAGIILYYSTRPDPRFPSVITSAGDGFWQLCYLVKDWTGRMLLLQSTVPFYGRPGPPDILNMLLVATAIAFWFIMLFMMWKRRFYVGLFILFAFVLLAAPAAGVVLGTRTFLTGDRYLYVPGIALVLLLGMAWEQLKTHFPVTQKAQAGITLVTIAAMVGLSARASLHWQNSEAIWARTLAVYPDTAVAHNNMGIIKVNARQPAEAIKHYQQAARLIPTDWRAPANMANAYMNLGKMDLAEAAFKESLKRNPEYFNAWYDLGILYFQSGRFDDAEEAFGKAISVAPSNVSVWTYMGLVQLQKKSFERAIGCFAKARDLQPGNPEHYNNHAAALVKADRLEEGRAAYEHVLQRFPGNVQAQAALKRIRQEKSLPR